MSESRATHHAQARSRLRQGPRLRTQTRRLFRDQDLVLAEFDEAEGAPSSQRLSDSRAVWPSPPLARGYARTPPIRQRTRADRVAEEMERVKPGSLHKECERPVHQRQGRGPSASAHPFQRVQRNMTDVRARRSSNII
jgi:hypothetical protein